MHAANVADGVRAAMWPRQLPADVTASILLLLSAFDKLAGRAVNRAWRAALSSPEQWREIRVDPRSRAQCFLLSDGLPWVPPFVTAIRHAVRIAGGSLVTLDFSGCVPNPVALPELVQLLLDCADSLTALRVLRVFGCGDLESNESFDGAGSMLTRPYVEALLRATPRLTRLDADVYGSIADSYDMLRNEAPFVPLHIRNLRISLHAWQENMSRLFADALTTHVNDLTEVHIRFVGIPPDVFGVLVDALLAMNVRVATVTVSASSYGHLARLLRGGVLTRLNVYESWILRDQDPEDHENFSQWVDFCAAVRDSQALKHLWLRMNIELPRLPELLHSLMGHPLLETILLEFECDEPGAVITSAAMLVAANAPKLREMRIQDWEMTPNHLREVLRALGQHNTHLRSLHFDITYHNYNNCAFVVERKLQLSSRITIRDAYDFYSSSDEEGDSDDEPEWSGLHWCSPDAWPDDPRCLHDAVRSVAYEVLGLPWDGQRAWQVAYRRWVEHAARRAALPAAAPPETL